MWQLPKIPKRTLERIEKRQALRNKVRCEVIARDAGRDIITGELGVDVHEVIPRSRFGRKSWKKCYQPKNMCVLTRVTHCYVHEHGKMGIRLLLNTLQGLYGYNYDDEPWRPYIVEDE